MAEYADVFWGIFLFSLGLFTLLSGLFTAYFGAGKSRAIGFVLTIFGIAVIIAFASLTWNVVPTVVTPLFDQEAITTSLVGVVGSALGAIAALMIFLISIMKA